MSVAPQRQPVYRPFAVTVAAVRRLTPHFLRVTFTGEDLDLFGDTCLDQRVKLVLPLPREEPFAHFPGGEDWFRPWRELPDQRRNPIRTFTARAVRPHLREVDIDIALHEHTGAGPGPAAAWAEQAAPGMPLLIVGPDSRGDSALCGVEWRPGAARRVLLVGDETAVPAIASILEQAPSDLSGQAFLEVPTPDDILPLAHPDGIEVVWLPRAAGEVTGERIVADVPPALERFPRPVAETSDADFGIDEILWETPESDEHRRYAWIAGESAMVRAMRRTLIGSHGWSRKDIAFMGYWRAGHQEC
ncbi:MAG: siderophore-interacting protein [Micrococcales bacterium]|nr:siderophore-interacting protein [Micrococcales bacterium]